MIELSYGIITSMLLSVGAIWYIYTLPKRFTFTPPESGLTYTREYVSRGRQKIQYVQHIPILWYPAPSDIEDPFTIIFSHGNGWDIGIGDHYIYELSRDLGVNILSYDYPGYGIRTDKCNEDQCYKDIHIIYEWLTQDKNIPFNKIILLGHSLGSGPSIDLASKVSRKLGGLILISPFTSIVRTVSSLLARIPYLDMFPNIHKMEHVKVPVYIIHGQRDWIVPYKHSLKLSQKCENYLWLMTSIGEGSHNNIITTYRSHFITQVLQFIEYLRQTERKS